MVTRENDCCSCNLPCLGSGCELTNNPHYYCDECDDEVSYGELYWVDDEQLCGYCALKRLEVVEP